MVLKLVIGAAAVGAAAILVAAHEVGGYIGDVYDHEAFWKEEDEDEAI